MKVKVNELPGASDGRVHDVWCLGRELQPGATYVADQATLERAGEAGEGLVEVPIRSIGRNRTDGRLYAATDFRFVNYPGHLLVWPVVAGEHASIDLAEMADEPGRYEGTVVWKRTGEVDQVLWHCTGQPSMKHAIELCHQFATRCQMVVPPMEVMLKAIDESEGE